MVAIEHYTLQQQQIQLKISHSPPLSLSLFLSALLLTLVSFILFYRMQISIQLPD